MTARSPIYAGRNTCSSDSPHVGLIWDDSYQLVLLVSLGQDQCRLATELTFEPGTKVVIDLGGGYLALGTIVEDANCHLTVAFSRQLADRGLCKPVPRKVLLAAGAPRYAVSLAQRGSYPCESPGSGRKREFGENSLPVSSRLMRTATIGVVMWSSVASAETYSRIDVSTGVQYDSDPFLTDGPDTGAASVQTSVRPTLRYEDPTFEIQIQGFVDHSEYFDRYSSDTAWGFFIDGRQQFDPLTSMNFSARAVTLGRGANSFVRGALPVPDGGLPDPDPILPDPEVPDLSELGSSTKTRQLSATLGIDRRLSELEIFSAGVTLGDVTTDDTRTNASDGGVDYRTGVLSLAYQRTVSAQTTVLADLQGSLVNYGNTSLGDGFVVNAAAGMETALGERVTAKATVGVSYSKREAENGNHDQAVTPSFAASACRKAETTNSCLSATRTVQPTTSGRLRKITAFGATQSWRLSAKDEVALRVSYAQNDDFRVAGDAGVTNKVIGISGFYSGEIAERLSISVSPGLERRFGETGRSNASNVYVNVALNYRIGSHGD